MRNKRKSKSKSNKVLEESITVSIAIPTASGNQDKHELAVEALANCTGTAAKGRSKKISLKQAINDKISELQKKNSTSQPKELSTTTSFIDSQEQITTTNDSPVTTKPDTENHDKKRTPKIAGQDPRTDTSEFDKIALSIETKERMFEGMLPLNVTTSLEDMDKVELYFGPNGVKGESAFDVNGRCLNDGSTPLHLAIRNKHMAVVSKLLEFGADAALTDYIGDNALMSAIKSGDANAINAVWPHRMGLNINHSNVLGLTALHLASDRKWECCINFLLQNKADPNCQANNGVTPLMIAATKGDMKTVERLIKAGADLLMEDNDGNTCICKAFCDDQKDISRYLLGCINGDKIEMFVRTRLDLILDPPTIEDEKKLLETRYFPILEECTDHPKFRNAFYSQRAIHKLTLRMEDHMHNLEIAMYAAQIVFGIMFKFGNEIDKKFVKQYLNCKGPDLSIHMTKFYTEVWKMSEKSTIIAFLPIIGICEISEGKTWLKKNYLSVSEYVNFFQKDGLKQYLSPNPELHWCLEDRHFYKVLQVWYNFYDVMNDIQTEQRERNMQELLEDEARNKERENKKKEKQMRKNEKQNRQSTIDELKKTKVKETINIPRMIECSNDNANTGDKKSSKHKYVDQTVSNVTVDKSSKKCTTKEPATDTTTVIAQTTDRWKTVQTKKHTGKEKTNHEEPVTEQVPVSKEKISPKIKTSKKKSNKHYQKVAHPPIVVPNITSGPARWADVAKGIVKTTEQPKKETNDRRDISFEKIPSPTKVKFVETDFPSLTDTPTTDAQSTKKANRTKTGSFTFQFHEPNIQNNPIISQNDTKLDQISVDKSIYAAATSMEDIGHNFANLAMNTGDEIYMSQEDDEMYTEELNCSDQNSTSLNWSYESSEASVVRVDKATCYADKCVYNNMQAWSTNDNNVSERNETWKQHDEFRANADTPPADHYQSKPYQNSEENIEEVTKHITTDDVKHHDETKITVTYVGNDGCQVELDTLLKHQANTFPIFKEMCSFRTNDPFIELQAETSTSAALWNPVDALFNTTEEIPSWFIDSDIPKDDFFYEDDGTTEQKVGDDVSDDIVATDPAIIGYSNMNLMNNQSTKQSKENSVVYNEQTTKKSRFLGNVIPLATSSPDGTNISNECVTSMEAKQDHGDIERQTAVIRPIQSNNNQFGQTGNCALGQSILENALRIQYKNDEVLYPGDLDGVPLDDCPDEKHNDENDDGMYFPSFHADTKLSAHFNERDISIFHKMQQIQIQQLNNYYKQYSRQIANNMSMHQSNFLYYAACAGLNKQQVDAYFQSIKVDPEDEVKNKSATDSGMPPFGSNASFTKPNTDRQHFGISQGDIQSENQHSNLKNIFPMPPPNPMMPPHMQIPVSQRIPTTGKISPSRGATPTATMPQSLPLQPPLFPPNMHSGNIHVIQATQAAMGASVMNQIKEMYKSMMKSKMKSIRWKEELWQMRNMTPEKQMVVGKIVIPKEDNDRTYLSRHSTGPIVLGFLVDGSEVAVKLIDWKDKEFSEDELQHLIDMDVSKYFMNKYKAFASQDGFYYIAMELYEYTLDDYINFIHENSEIIDGIVYNKLVWQFLRGLASLHQHCLMVHGELRPDNVVIDRDGNVRITGYGLGRNTSREALFVEYNDADKCWLSPEVLVHKQKVSFKSDIWVAGMLIYYVLSGGKNPFGEKTSDIICNISQQTYAIEYISEEAGHLLSIMLSVNKTERPCISDALRHPYFWADEKRLRFVLIAGSDVLRDLKNGVPMDGTVRDSMISIIGSMPCNINIINWMPEIESVVMREMKGFRQYKNNVVELVLFVYNCCLHFEKMSEAAMEIIDEPCKYFLSKYPTLFMTVYRGIKLSNRKEKTCYKPFF